MNPTFDEAWACIAEFLGRERHEFQIGEVPGLLAALDELNEILPALRARIAEAPALMEQASA